MDGTALRRRLPGQAAEVLRGCLIAGAYYGSARLGLMQELVREQVTPLWPPTGIALVCLLWWGARVWPAIAVGAFLVNVEIGPGTAAVLGIAVGNTLAPVCSWLLLRRAGFRPALDRLRDALALVFLGALVGMVVSATVGTSVLVLSGAVPAGDFLATWSVWWTGDAMGVLVVAPFLLTLRAVRVPELSPWYRWAEAAALLGGTAAVTLVATRSTVNLLFLIFPFLIWAAFRFRLPGAAACSLIVCLMVIGAAADAAGPFQDHGLAAQMFILQAFNGSVAMTALLLSAVVTERNQTHQEIAHVCRLLAGAVNRLSSGEGPPDAPAQTDGRPPESRPGPG